jgi:hypothetical protein
VEVDDREPAEHGRSHIGPAVTAARQALDRHTFRLVARRGDDRHRQRALEAVVPLHLDLDTAVDLDRRARDVPAVGPYPGRWQVSVEPVRGRLETDCQTGRPADDASGRDRKRIDEWGERVSQARRDRDSSSPVPVHRISSRDNPAAAPPFAGS